jgi:hypothetical protein
VAVEYLDIENVANPSFLKPWEVLVRQEVLSLVHP